MLEKISSMLKSSVGPMFTESNVDEFKVHLKSIISGGEKSIAKRISILFANWSNLNAHFGDSVEVDSQSLPMAIYFRDYKFSIASELVHLCPIVLSKVSGRNVQISSQEDFEQFKNILSIVDEFVRTERMTDMQAYEALMNVLEEHFAK